MPPDGFNWLNSDTRNKSARDELEEAMVGGDDVNQSDILVDPIDIEAEADDSTRMNNSAASDPIPKRAVDSTLFSDTMQPRKKAKLQPGGTTSALKKAQCTETVTGIDDIHCVYIRDGKSNDYPSIIGECFCRGKDSMRTRGESARGSRSAPRGERSLERVENGVGYLSANF